MTEDYPLPDTETLFNKLEGSKLHVKNDISSALNQIMLNDEAQDIRVVNKTLGPFEFLRLPQVMKNGR